ncbi:hypothetical protein AVEN_274930-1 [Araneus ventricosus]|uniref:Uncharacterized protein n=1 Tax=Araneus ventricosus TaxID=182803 RepID=A0A4Y2MPX6_ARAVE|nr:hypothetical protein AVEN_274930-1 [Araneus ventricosus]
MWGFVGVRISTSHVVPTTQQSIGTGPRAVLGLRLSTHWPLMSENLPIFLRNGGATPSPLEQQRVFSFPRGLIREQTTDSVPSLVP